MPRNVRNFWVTLDVDGRGTPMAGGPAGKDGGFEARIKIRADGEVADAVLITGNAMPDGSLEVLVTPCNDARVTLDHIGTTMILRSKR